MAVFSLENLLNSMGLLVNLQGNLYYKNGEIKQCKRRAEDSGLEGRICGEIQPV